MNITMLHWKKKCTCDLASRVAVGRHVRKTIKGRIGGHHRGHVIGHLLGPTLFAPGANVQRHCGLAWRRADGEGVPLVLRDGGALEEDVLAFLVAVLEGTGFGEFQRNDLTRDSDAASNHQHYQKKRAQQTYIGPH